MLSWITHAPRQPQEKTSRLIQPAEDTSGVTDDVANVNVVVVANATLADDDDGGGGGGGGGGDFFTAMFGHPGVRAGLTGVFAFLLTLGNAAAGTVVGFELRAGADLRRTLLNNIIATFFATQVGGREGGKTQRRYQETGTRTHKYSQKGPKGPTWQP